MDDELETFIREQKARVAEDKASLEQEPPYMEIKAKPHRGYGSTVKENIPPHSVVQGKEESGSVCLPLGVEYERKKQKLQHELRMDYRRYMAQRKRFDPAEPGPLIHLDNGMFVKHHLLEDQTGLLSKPRASSQRDAATLTEDNKWLHRGRNLCPEEEEEEEEEEEKEEHQESEDEELVLMEGRRSRPTRAEAGYEKRRHNLTNGRERRENPVRPMALTTNEDAEFATGLIIGTTDTDEALKRRKDRYRQELQEQIAEQHRNRKREKDLELKVAATGANDPEKQPDRIRQFGLSRRKDRQVSEPSASAESESSSRALPRNEKTPPPEHPHVAFQSPLLGYSSSLGGGGLSPHTQPAAPSFPRAVDTPRVPVLAPHPPSSLSGAYRSLYAEPHPCCGTRNLLDPHMAYYGQLPAPGPCGLPVSYWNVPTVGSVHNRYGNHSPHSQHSGSSFPEPQIMSNHEVSTVEPHTHARGFPSERSRLTKDRNYRDDLKEQIREQQERRCVEREERERYEARLQAEMKSHQPWGRGGGGAPLRDGTGNLIADLNQMHKLNEEAYINPEQWQRRGAAASVTTAQLPDPNERVSGFTHVQTSQFARGNVFPNQPSQQQIHEKDQYKSYLKQQIEEKMRKKAEEREQVRQEEEKEERRLAEQRARIQREFEEEQERKRRKEMEQKAKNEEHVHLAEQRKKEEERRKKKEVEEKENEELKKQYERERQARVEEVRREPSPPIPALRGKHGPRQFTPRPPTGESQPSTGPLSERSLSGLQSPPVPACRNQLRAASDRRDVFSELSVLRRQLRSEQKRLEGRLQQGEWEELESPLSDRHRERPPVDVFDMARMRLQAPVRRPNSRNMEPPNLLRIHDSLQLKYTDGKSRLGSSEAPHPEEVMVMGRRRRDYRDPYQQLSSQRSTAQDDYFDLSPTNHNDYLRNVMRRSARGSLLESESAFIDPLGEASPLPRTPEVEKPPQLSARERRRLVKHSQHHHQERAASSQCLGQRDAYAARTGGGQPQETKGRTLDCRRGNTAGPVDLSDDDSSPPRFSLHNRSSVETVATDPWMRPGTSDARTFLDGPLTRERFAT